MIRWTVCNRPARPQAGAPRRGFTTLGSRVGRFVQGVHADGHEFGVVILLSPVPLRDKALSRRLAVPAARLDRCRGRPGSFRADHRQSRLVGRQPGDFAIAFALPETLLRHRDPAQPSQSLARRGRPFPFQASAPNLHAGRCAPALAGRYRG